MVLETTGLADPAPVLHTAMVHPYLVLRYRLDGVVTVVDAVNGEATLDAHVEAVKQAAVADRIVLTKTDLADSASSSTRIVARLRALNPAAPILDAAKGEATAERLLDCGLYDPERKIPDVKKWLADEAYADAHAPVITATSTITTTITIISTATATTSTSAPSCSPPMPPIPAGTLHMFLELLRAIHGAKLLRLKGIVKLAETPDTPVVVHGVQHVFHPTARLERWPDDDHRTRLVFITRDMPERDRARDVRGLPRRRRRRPAGPRRADRQSAGAVRRRRTA